MIPQLQHAQTRTRIQQLQLNIEDFSPAESSYKFASRAWIPAPPKGTYFIRVQLYDLGSRGQQPVIVGERPYLTLPIVSPSAGDVRDRTGTESAGTRWVHMVPAGGGVQRAPAVTTGSKEAQVRPPLEPRPGILPGGGPEFDSPSTHQSVQGDRPGPLASLPTAGEAELALLAWATALLIVCVIARSIRPALVAVIDALFVPKLLTTFILMAMYGGALVWLLSLAQIWTPAVTAEPSFGSLARRLSSTPTRSTSWWSSSWYPYSRSSAGCSLWQPSPSTAKSRAH
jgi:hypothetical protein